MAVTKQRIRLYALVVIVLIVIVGIMFNISVRRRLSDVRVLNDVRSFSYALEQYKQDYWRYPGGGSLDLRNRIVLTENGFAPGETVYYLGDVPSKKAVVYSGEEDGYRISFTLRREWSEQGLETKKCTVTENYTFSCSPQADESEPDP